MSAFLLGLADDNFDVLIERVEKPEQPVGGESFEPSAEQRGHPGLVGAEQVLDRLRLKVYETQGRAYATALMREKSLKGMPLLEQHAVRLNYAERLLPKHPLREHGVDRLTAQAKDAALMGIDPGLARYLPEVGLHFARFVV